nr:hypothetical protein [Tanacetum cinerariifolium]
MTRGFGKFKLIGLHVIFPATAVFGDRKSFSVVVMADDGWLVAGGGCRNIGEGESLENQMDHKVKTIRCDNGTEFKNKIMNEFYEMKGTKVNINARQTGKKTVPSPQYVLLPLLTSDSQGSKSSGDEVADNARKKNPGRERAQRNEFESMFRQDKDANSNSIFTLVSAVEYTYVNLGGLILVNAATLPNVDLPSDPLMPDLENTVDLHDTRIFSVAYDDKVKGAVADFNKLELTTVVSYTQEEGIGYDEVFAPVARIEAISQDKYMADILKKFDFSSVKTSSTLIETDKALLKDEEAKDVDVHLYTSMIGSLMYLTASRPSIMFVVCACARLQVTPKVSHLHAVKRIFRYLKGQPELGFWYPRDSPFDLEAFSDSDYVRVSLDKKSTTGGCQILRKRLISWFAETHNLVAFLKKSTESEGFEQIIDFLNASHIKYALTVNPTVYTSCIEQFWATAKVKNVNGEAQIQALVDKKKVIMSEASIRRDIRFEDEGGVDCLSNEVIFEQLTFMGYEKLSQKLTFYKAFFSPQWKFLIHIILQCLSAKTTAWNEFDITMASAIICLATNQNFNFSKYIFDNMVKHLDGRVKFLVCPRFVQVFLDNQIEGMDKHNANFVISSHIKKVLYLEKAKTTQAVEISSLKMRVKKLERKKKSRTSGIKGLRKVRTASRVESSAEEANLGDQEDASKQERKIDDIDQDIEITLVIMDATTSENVEQSAKVAEKEVSTADPVTNAGEIVTIAGVEVTTAATTSQISKDELILAQTLIEIKAAKPKDNTQAMMDAHYELAQRLQTEEQGELTIEERLKLFVELMDKRKKYFAKLRSEEKRRKPPTKAQKRNQMCTYLKNMENYKHNQLKSKSFKEIQMLFNNTMKWIEALVPMDTELVKDSEKLVEGSEKAAEGSEKAQEGNDDDVTIEATRISSKSPTIVNYKIYKEGNKSYFKNIRADGNSQSYLTLGRMFKNFNREDLEVLWSIVKEIFEKKRLVDDKDNL